MSTGTHDPCGPALRVGAIHTVGTLVPVFGELAGDLLPGATLTDVVDESLLGDAIAAGVLTPEIEDRLAGHVRSLIDHGVDAVLVTCSSLGAAVDRLARLAPVPLLRVDAAMADAAVRDGTKIGVLATLSTTMAPTVDLIRHRAHDAGADVQVVSYLCDGAFAALKAGEVHRHDELVRAGLRALEPEADLVALAQASMARVLLADDVESRVPIMTSPRLAVERLARLLGEAGPDSRTEKESP